MASLDKSQTHLKKLSASDATHLMWRIGFGASPAEIALAQKEGLQATVDRYLPVRDPKPLEHSKETIQSGFVESNEFENTEPLLRLTALDSDDINQLKAWWLYRMRFSKNPLQEKVALLWHNHFATSNEKVRSVVHMFDQNQLIRKHALGDFRKLLHGMAKDVAMLIWLDSNSNRKRHANENFAREIMELFALGVGNYTEKDIQEAARAFTGWHVRNDKFWFNKIQHDDTDKTVFGKTQNFDGNHVVDLCLDQDACPRFIALKLLREFVSDTPEKSLIESLAKRIRHHDFRIDLVLRELFVSEAFFAKEHRWAIVKSPIQLVIGAYRTLDVRPNLARTTQLLAQLGQDVFQPPSVKGWEGGRLWVNSATMLQRMNFAGRLCSGDQLGEISIGTLQAAASDPSAIGSTLIGQELAADVLAQINSIGIESPEDQGRRVLHALLSLPEFQLT